MAAPKKNVADKSAEVKAYVDKLAKKIANLSPKLRDVARLISEQKNNFDIAKENNTDVNQAGQQVSALYRELGIDAGFKKQRRPLVTAAYKFYAAAARQASKPAIAAQHSGAAPRQAARAAATAPPRPEPSPAVAQAPATKVLEGEIAPVAMLAGVETAEEGRAILERVRIAISNAVYEVVQVERIRPMPNQPRKHFNQERLLRLSESIKVVGQITPGYLRKVPLDAENRDRELVDGERRWRAVLMAGVATYRAMLVDVDQEAAQYIVSVIANFNREGHTTLEIADSIRTMHEQLKLGMAEIAESIGFHPIYVTNLYGLRRLTLEVRKLLDPDIENNRRLPTAAAIEISRLPAEHQLPLALRVVKREVNLRTLRSEVVAVSERHGLPIQQRKVDPHMHRRALERKISLLHRQAADLKSHLEETPMPILSGWTSGNVSANRSELELARKAVGASIEALDRIERQK